MRCVVLIISITALNSSALASDLCQSRWIAAARTEQFSDALLEASNPAPNQPTHAPKAVVCDQSGKIQSICVPTKFNQTGPTEYTVLHPNEIYFAARRSRSRTDLQAEGGWVEIGGGSSSMADWMSGEPKVQCQGQKCLVSCPVTTKTQPESSEWIGCYYNGKPEVLKIPNGCRQIGFRIQSHTLAFAVVKYIQSSGLMEDYIGPANADFELFGFNKGKKGGLITRLQKLMTDPVHMDLTLTEADLQNQIVGYRERAQSIVQSGIWDDLRISVDLIQESQYLKLHLDTTVFVSEVAVSADQYWTAPSAPIAAEYRDYIIGAFSSALKDFCGSSTENLTEQHLIGITCNH